MASDRQIRANRRNAQQSTGPSSPSGKKRSSRNSLKHGVFSHELVLPWEDSKAFQRLLSGLIDDLRPEGTTEHLLVEQMAVSAWKLRRLTSIESAIMTKQWQDGLNSPLNRGQGNEARHHYALAFTLPANQVRLNEYQTLLHREFHRAYKTLLQRQQERLSIIEGTASAISEDSGDT